MLKFEVYLKLKRSSHVRKFSGFIYISYIHSTYTCSVQLPVYYKVTPLDATLFSFQHLLSFSTSEGFANFYGQKARLCFQGNTSFDLSLIQFNTVNTLTTNF
jgi:hypothetical protein